ncbi:MAG: GntR family transcriptional regulator [Bacilli bacterium]|nr:GntR family transcriptional regulator [Bacilli bacterium]
MNFNNNIPIYVQLIEQLKTYIISGQIKPGEKLPSVRDLALKTKVNPNTMQKALVELEEIDLIYTERTNGKYVTENENTIKKLKQEYAKNISAQYFKSMEKIGYSKKDTIKYLKELGEDK